MPDMLAHALELSRKGFTVIPIHPKGKEPAIPSWAEYQKIRPTEKQIRAWWKDMPDANIAIITGRASRVVVVDLDSTEYYERFISTFPTGFVAKTSKGYHLYYMYPNGYSDWLSGNPPIKNMDFRGDGGYVIAPPSIHSSGAKYEWVSLESFGALPPDIVTLVKQHQQTSKVSAIFSNGLVPNQEVRTANDTKWVTDLMSNGSPNGQRNQDLARLAGYFFGKGLPEDLVVMMLTRWYEKTDKKDFDYDVFEKTIKSVKKTSESTKKSTNDKDKVYAPITQEALKKSVKSFGDFLSEGEEEIKWMVEGWLPEDTTGLMVSPPGCYKTWIMLALALSLSTGYPFFGKHKVNNPRRVLVIQQEDSKSIIRQRIRTIFAQMCIDADVRYELVISESPHKYHKDSLVVNSLTMHNYEEPLLDIYHDDRLVNLGDKESMELLQKLIEQNKYGAVFIDPMYSLGLEDDQFLSESAKRMIIFKQWRNAYHTSFFILHHKKKSQADMESSSLASINSRSEIWGSQFLNAWLETGIYMNRTKGMNDNTVGISRTFKQSKSPLPVSATFDINTSTDDLRFKVQMEDLTPVDKGTPARYGTGTPVITPDQRVTTTFDDQGNIQSLLLATMRGKFDLYPLFRDNVTVNPNSVSKYVQDIYGISMQRSSFEHQLEKMAQAGVIVKTSSGYELPK